MTVEAFLEMERLASADEIASLCDAVGIRFGFGKEGPVLKVTPENKRIGEAVSKIIGREPWRSQVIERRLKDAPWPCDECGVNSPGRVRGEDNKLRCGPCADQLEKR